eukprot:m.243958 g.243958  ORF g.243958 m.243958 type:complete len:918 (-) comp14365_c0_seq1:118-2871(-)
MFLHASQQIERQNKRFSLLLLEHGETYLEDFGVNYFPYGCSDEEAVRKSIRGRLKLCSHSILLDPQDMAYPILKFSFKKCLKVDRWAASLMSPIKGDIMVLVATEYVRMKPDNLVRPYEFVKLPSPMEFRFAPNYVSLAEVLTKTKRLFTTWQLPPRQIPAAIDAICTEFQQTITFNTAWLEELSEKILFESVANMVLPLVSNPGRVLLTNKRVYFQPFNNVDSDPVQKYRLRDITRVVPRRYLLRSTGIELFHEGEYRLYLAFASKQKRDEFNALLRQQPELQLQCEDQVNVMLSWQCGALSTFDYLMYLNSMADRSINDLAQYPVFPWVIADTSSATLDLTDPKSFRDLSKPIGALNEERLAAFQTRYREMPDPKFLYGTHYSTPGYVLFYTIRSAPEYALCLQNGKYDHADRLFTSVAETWSNVLNGAADVKELIPEFYMPGGEFLLNSLGLDLGTCQDGAKVGNVALPPWASSAADFTRKCREALESEYVSANIHQWIDLIFGYKQLGPEAVRANNLFYHLTYEGAVDLEKITDPAERQAYEAQILEFGQTPKQLFTLPHPARRLGMAMPMSPLPAASPAPQEDVPAAPLRDSVASPAPAAAAAASSVPPMGWAGLSRLQCVTSVKAHRAPITAMTVDAASKIIYTVSKDSVLKLHSLETDSQLHSATVGSLALSSCVPVSTGKIVVLGSWDNSVYAYSIEYGRVIDSWMAHDDAVSTTYLSGNLLFTASWDSTIKVWNYDSAGNRCRDDQCLYELNEHDGEVKCLAVHEGTRLFASGGADGKVVVFSLDTYDVVHQFSAHEQAVTGICFSMDGRRLASCSEDGFLRVFDVELRQQVFVTDALGPLECVQYDGQFVVGGSKSGTLCVWDLVGNQCLFKETRHTGPVTCLYVSADGRSVVTASDDKTYAVWRVQ